MRPERILADMREVMPRNAILTTDVGWNKNGVGQQFPIYTPGSVLTPGGYRNDGFRPTRRSRRQDRGSRSRGHLDGRRRRLRPESGDACNGPRNEPGRHLGGDEQQRLRYHRRPAESALRTTVGTTFSKDATRAETSSPNYAAIAAAYGVRGVRIREAAEFKPVLAAAIKAGKPCRHRRGDDQQPDADAGHWNILDIYSPGRDVSHVAVP